MKLPNFSTSFLLLQANHNVKDRLRSVFECRAGTIFHLRPKLPILSKIICVAHQKRAFFLGQKLAVQTTSKKQEIVRTIILRGLEYQMFLFATLMAPLPPYNDKKNFFSKTLAHIKKMLYLCNRFWFSHESSTAI